MPANRASEIVKFTISIPRETCTNAKAKYSSSVVPPDPSVHFYHCGGSTNARASPEFGLVIQFANFMVISSVLDLRGLISFQLDFDH